MKLEYFKALLRISQKSSAFDVEIQSLIDACLVDLSSVGIRIDMVNESALQVIVGIYVKANFGLDNKLYEKYMNAYETMKNEIRMNGGMYVE